MSDAWLVPFTTKLRSWSGGFGVIDTGDCCVCEGSRDMFPDTVAAAIRAQAAWVTALLIRRVCSLMHFVIFHQQLSKGGRKARKEVLHTLLNSDFSNRDHKIPLQNGAVSGAFVPKVFPHGLHRNPTETAQTRHFRQSRRGTGSRIV